MSLSLESSVPSEAVRGEPDEGEDFSVEDAVLFAADLAGHPEYVLNLHPVVGFAS